MIFSPETLSDSLSETVGYKSGLALSVTELCEHLSETKYPDIIRLSETQTVRLRSEEYEELFYKLLHRVGYTQEEYDGDVTGIALFHKYRLTAPQEYRFVTERFIEMLSLSATASDVDISKPIDPKPFMLVCFNRYGRLGLDIAMERLECYEKILRLSPHSTFRYVEFKDQLQLSSLFKGTNVTPETGRYIDQRFLNYLNRNPSQLSSIHWRKFEELAAEYFFREGYQVELGPGTNDDGVDIRIWRPTQKPSDQPLCLIQCKRQQSKIEKVVVKGLHADVVFQKAEYGLIVTTSELSPGARSTISIRGYPIHEVDNARLNEWLKRLRVPGTGIVRN